MRGLRGGGSEASDDDKGWMLRARDCRAQKEQMPRNILCGSGAALPRITMQRLKGASGAGSTDSFAHAYIALDGTYIRVNSTDQQRDA